MIGVDILVFGPHPDDIEIGIGGSVAVHVDLGHTVGLCDLTKGELGSNGTVEQRMSEAQAAAEVLGVAWRENLGWPDGDIAGDGTTADHVRVAAELIRRVRPSVVVVPHWRDRHPDHTAASRVLREAVFRAGLRRYAADGTAWKPDWTCHYFINDLDTPAFVVDVTDSYDRKREALACHQSQFRPTGDEAIQTRLTGSRFLQMIESRDAHLGSLIGAGQAEGVAVKEPLVRAGLLKS
jgi:bacillithiol biosynthesis deacetylase BshB1